MINDTKDIYVAPKEDTTGVKDVFLEAEQKKRHRNCVACGKLTTHASTMAPGDATTAYENILIMELYGGYGLFFDDMDSGDHTVILCHDCAHDTCVKLPWLAQLIKPETSHSHTMDYVEVNSDHFGWDYEKRQNDREE